MSEPVPATPAEPKFLSWVVSHKRICGGVGVFLLGLILGAILF